MVKPLQGPQTDPSSACSVRQDTVAALRCHFTSHGTLRGTTAEYMAGTIAENSHEDPTPLASEIAVDEDGAPIEGDSEKETLSILTVSAKTGVHVNIYISYSCSQHIKP